MASLHALPLLSSSSSSCNRRTMAALRIPKSGTVQLKNTARNMVEKLSSMAGQYTIPTKTSCTTMRDEKESTSSPVATTISELYLIADAVADRIEMHTNVGEQRDNWNTLLLTSINTITLTAGLMAALSAATTTTTLFPLPPLNLSSSILFSAAAGMMVVMNKIQPSQLAEEQRNAARLFKQLHREIQTTLAIGKTPTEKDVKDSMEKVLALDRAYPLPLLGVMLDKFPETVEPTVWWPSSSTSSPKEQHETKQFLGLKKKVEKNGWSEDLEEEMIQIVGVLQRKDAEEYNRLGNLALKINKILAVSGPSLAGLAAVGSAFMGSSPSHGGLGLAVTVAAGALASVVNTLEHGGQVGMVFEMYRNSAGFFKLLEESIEATLNQKDAERRENGESFELKVALSLGRSLSELRDLASHGSKRSRDEESTEEFASKLF